MSCFLFYFPPGSFAVVNLTLYAYYVPSSVNFSLKIVYCHACYNGVGQAGNTKVSKIGWTQPTRV